MGILAYTSRDRPVRIHRLKCEQSLNSLEAPIAHFRFALLEKHLQFLLIADQFDHAAKVGILPRFARVRVGKCGTLVLEAAAQEEVNSLNPGTSFSAASAA